MHKYKMMVTNSNNVTSKKKNATSCQIRNAPKKTERSIEHNCKTNGWSIGQNTNKQC